VSTINRVITVVVILIAFLTACEGQSESKPEPTELQKTSFYEESVAIFVEIRSITQKDSWGNEPKKNLDLFLATGDDVFEDHMHNYFIHLNNMEVLSVKEQELLMSLSDLKRELSGLAGSLASPNSFNPDTVKKQRAEYITAEEKVVTLIEQLETQ
jgi:hypothetical protein